MVAREENVLWRLHERFAEPETTFSKPVFFLFWFRAPEQHTRHSLLVDIHCCQESYRAPALCAALERNTRHKKMNAPERVDAHMRPMIECEVCKKEVEYLSLHNHRVRCHGRECLFCECELSDTDIFGIDAEDRELLMDKDCVDSVWDSITSSLTCTPNNIEKHMSSHHSDVLSHIYWRSAHISDTFSISLESLSCFKELMGCEEWLVLNNYSEPKECATNPRGFHTAVICIGIQNTGDSEHFVFDAVHACIHSASRELCVDMELKYSPREHAKTCITLEHTFKMRRCVCLDCRVHLPQVRLPPTLCVAPAVGQRDMSRKSRT